MAIIKSHAGRVLLDTTRSIIFSLPRAEGNEFYLKSADCSLEVDGIELPAYNLLETKSPNDYRNSFYAYFCDYDKDTLHRARIGQAMDYFFTAPLTGCSIGFGNADRVGRTWVGHANAATAAVNLKNYLDSRGTKPTVAVLRTAQQLKQQKMLVGAGLHNVQGPANYGHHRLESKERLVTTLIGFRDRNNGRWSFIRQTFDQTLFV